MKPMPAKKNQTNGQRDFSRFDELKAKPSHAKLSGQCSALAEWAERPPADLTNFKPCKAETLQPRPYSRVGSPVHWLNGQRHSSRFDELKAQPSQAMQSQVGSTVK